MQMVPVDSTLISHRGYDPDAKLMRIRFRVKQGTGSLYEYANISPELYAQGCQYRDAQGKLSFGQFFQRYIKPNDNKYPFRKLEDADPTATPDKATSAPPVSFQKTLKEAVEQTVDVTPQGQEIPVHAETDPIPENVEELKAKALELRNRAASIVINSPEAYALAEKTGVAIARMRDALEKTFRPGISEKHKAWQAELAILNFYDNPLEEQQEAFRRGMATFRREDDLRRERLAAEARRQQEADAERDAVKRAENLKLADAIAAEERGDAKLAEVILNSPALPLAPVMAAPVHIPSNVPKSKASSYTPKWCVEFVDKDGKYIGHIDDNGKIVGDVDYSLIPPEYLIVNIKSLKNVARDLKDRTNISGVRVYDAGNIRFSKKG